MFQISQSHPAEMPVTVVPNGHTSSVSPFGTTSPKKSWQKTARKQALARTALNFDAIDTLSSALNLPHLHRQLPSLDRFIKPQSMRQAFSLGVPADQIDCRL